MKLLPDWAPNIHPMIIHFPIVLLILAVLLDLTGLLLSKSDWIRKSAFLLYILGTIAAVIAFITGNAASDSIEIPANAFSAINEHADWAETTLWFFSIYTIIRLSIGIFFKSLKKIFIIPIVLIGILGIYFLYQTGDHGAQMVFGYGVGTGNLIKQEKQKNDTTEKEHISDSTFTINGNGSWKLIADNGIIKVLSEKFKWIEGSLDGLSPMFDPAESVLMFHKVPESIFIYDNKLKGVQVTAKINIDDFTGELELIHHFVDKNNYDFLGLKDGEISLSRKSNGEIKIFEKEKFTNKDWLEIKVVSEGTHFRGYINNKMVVHGHGTEPESGGVGIRINGNGIFYLSLVEVQSLQ
ncbi:MAG: hypothetical protein HND40_06845 [Ignavibacteriota bacterium]|jgi:uncharacterized membrane protein|nr:hypothetical protein [Ignavibacteriota bacterium]MBV6420873.1 hypothetical protein [Ignavibacteriaceae bacterium]MCO6446855.1 hypothetical protein [Ignavibacterium album]MDT3696726.1 DUF2231 domain-containing protein [Ignavibacterium sp.]QKJ99294.1 MAG: hypothetical protein HND40_06845 [Ignavibacteriota bacterium]